MGLFKRLAGLLGLSRDEEQQRQQDDDTAAAADASTMSQPSMGAPAQHLPRKGFSVPVQVPVERSSQTPLLLPCPAGDGGLQGLRWYARRLRIDGDGDVADEFLVKVSPNSSISMEEDNQPLPRFEVNYSTRPAKVRNQVLLPNGKIQHQVEYQGRLDWL